MERFEERKRELYKRIIGSIISGIITVIILIINLNLSIKGWSFILLWILFTIGFYICIWNISLIIAIIDEKNREIRILKIIKANLPDSNKFKTVKIKSCRDMPILAYIILDLHKVKLKLDENNIVHLIVENKTGIIYKKKTNDYEWILENISFN